MIQLLDQDPYGYLRRNCFYRHISNPYYTQIEVAGGTGIGLRCGFNPGELLDFMLGLAAVDLYGDDLGGTAMVPHLLPLLQDPYFPVRREAVEALGDVGGKQEIQTLTDLSRKENNPQVKAAIEEALQKLTQ